MTDVAQVEHPTRLAALAAILPDDAEVPVRIQTIPGGVVAAYSPAQETRASVWALLVELFGPLRDVSVAGA